MTLVIVLFVAVQAALLLGASVHLSNVFLRDAKLGPAVWAFVMAGSALALSVYGGTADLQQAHCRPGDCAILLFSVACVRVILVNKETDQLSLERELANRAATAAVEAEQRARDAQQLVAAAAALEARAAMRPESMPAPSRANALQNPRGATRLVQPPTRPQV